MSVEYPIFVRDRDGGVTRFESEADALGQLEAVDVEDREYECWDSSGQILALKAHGIGMWAAGSFEIIPTGRMEDSSCFEEVKLRAEPYQLPLERTKGALRKLFNRS